MKYFEVYYKNTTVKKYRVAVEDDQDEEQARQLVEMCSNEQEREAASSDTQVTYTDCGVEDVQEVTAEGKPIDGS